MSVRFPAQMSGTPTEAFEDEMEGPDVELYYILQRNSPLRFWVSRDFVIY